MSSEVTQLLHRLRDGDQTAMEQLMPLVYNELHRIAQAFFRRRAPGLTLQPTALVHEAYVKLFEDAAPQFVDRSHFLAMMARVMRHVLVDHARAAGAVKRGGQARRVDLEPGIEIADSAGTRRVEILELDSALDALAKEKERVAAIVEMHYFGGMTAEEIAAATGRSVNGVWHDIRFARAWLRRELGA